MSSDKRWIPLEPDFERVEPDEGVDKGRVTLFGSIEIAIVGRGLPGDLPDAFDGIELGGVGRQPTQFDAVPIRVEPGHAFSLEVVARGVVDDEDYLSPIASNEPLEEAEGVSWKNVPSQAILGHSVPGSGRKQPS